MKTLKIFSLALVIVLVACVFVSCNQQEKAYEEAREALGTYFYNMTTDVEPDIHDMIIVVEKSGKWYSFPFTDRKLENGEVSNTAPETPESFVIEDNEENLINIPENITIFIPTP